MLGAVMEAFVVYLTFPILRWWMLKNFSNFFGVDYAMDVKWNKWFEINCQYQNTRYRYYRCNCHFSYCCLDHNRFFDTKLPDWLGIFQGSSFVVIIGFFLMLPIAFLVALIWPKNPKMALTLCKVSWQVQAC